ncbi:MAG: 30S ribosomal protein S2 [Candidatus Babeliaceae bacterium]|jgi:small subunit ribosomal protein S2
MIDLKLLIKNSVQYGHQTWRWCPKMRPYIWGHKGGVHLIDVSKTAHQMEKAAKFLESIAASGQPILWVGTKKAAQAAIKKASESSNSPSVTHRWIGGTLTNNSQVKKSITKLLHYQDILSKTEQYSYTKKEFGVFQKIVERLLKNIGGIRTLGWPVGAVVVVDVKKEHVVVKEAVAAGIPVVALVDTNGDPSMVDIVIPGNDDVPRAIEVVLDYLAEAVNKGQAQAEIKAHEMATEEASHAGLTEEMVKALGSDEEEESNKKAKRGSAGQAPAKRAARPSLNRKPFVKKAE